MSVDYYMMCPECKKTAIVFRVTASGFNPPDPFKSHAFFFGHSGHEGFRCGVHEDEKVMGDADEEGGWEEVETYG